MEHLLHYLIILLGILGSLILYKDKVKISSFVLATFFVLGLFLVSHVSFPLHILSHSSAGPQGTDHACCLPQPLIIVLAFVFLSPIFGFIAVKVFRKILVYKKIEFTFNSRSPPLFLFS